MHEIFCEKKGKILVVEGSGAARTQLIEVLKSLGFSDIVGVPSVKDAWGMLESEPIKWLLSPLNADSPENALQVIKLVTEHVSLKGMLVSLLLEEQETYVVPLGFQYGMLSWHRKPFTKDSLATEIKALVEKGEKCEWSSTLVAATYLREYLTKFEKMNELLSFERELTRTFPSNQELLLNLIAPMVKLGHKDEARSILLMLQAVDKTKSEQVEKMMAEYLAEESAEAGSDKKFNFLGIDRVVVVDSDESIHIMVKEIFSTCGITDIECFVSGLDALDYLKRKPNPGLVIQEWRIHKVPGPIFIQKAKARGAAAAPFIVLSSLLQKEDLPFIREMGVAALLEKPIDRENFLQRIAYIVQQERMPTDQAVMERKMRNLLAQGKFSDAQTIKERYFGDSRIPKGAKELMDAEFFFAMKDYKKAKEHAIEAVKHSGDSVFTLNLLGKILVNLREFDLSLKCFEKAQTIAPQNVERICAIAEVQSEIGNSQAAQEAIDKAKAIDEDSDRVHEAEARVAIDVKDVARAKKIMGNLEAIERVVAAMNNSAVAMANCGMVGEGIDKYMVTLESVPDKRKDIKAIVLYNLSLAYVKNAVFLEARDTLDKCLQLREPKIFHKASALRKKVEKALETGGGIDLKQDTRSNGQAVGTTKKQEGKEGAADAAEAEETAEVKVAREVTAVLTVTRGEIGCYLLYKVEKPDPKALKLLEKMPRFVHRQAIARAESHGADKVFKQTSRKAG